MFDFVKDAWPHINHEYVNGAIPASGTSYFSQCLQYQLPEKADLVLIEFAVNDAGTDGSGAPFELLVRNIRFSRLISRCGGFAAAGGHGTDQSGHARLASGTHDFVTAAVCVFPLPSPPQLRKVLARREDIAVIVVNWW